MKKLLLILIIGLLSYSCKSDLKLNKSEDEQNTNQPAQKDEIFEKGKTIFIKNCVACHYIGMDKIMTAPALGGITKRRKKEWLYNYTKRSIGMYQKGDSIAIALRKEGWALMTSFPNLTDNDLDNIYHFVEKKYEMTKSKKVVD